MVFLVIFSFFGSKLREKMCFETACFSLFIGGLLFLSKFIEIEEKHVVVSQAVSIVVVLFFKVRMILRDDRSEDRCRHAGC